MLASGEGAPMSSLILLSLSSRSQGHGSSTMWTLDIAGIVSPSLLLSDAYRATAHCAFLPPQLLLLGLHSHMPHFIPVPCKWLWVYVFIWWKWAIAQPLALVLGKRSLQEAYSLSAKIFFMSETENSCSCSCHPFFRQKIPKSCDQRSFHFIDKLANKPKRLSMSTVVCQTSSIVTRCSIWLLKLRAKKMESRHGQHGWHCKGA